MQILKPNFPGFAGEKVDVPKSCHMLKITPDPLVSISEIFLLHSGEAWFFWIVGRGSISDFPKFLLGFGPLGVEAVP